MTEAAPVTPEVKVVKSNEMISFDDVVSMDLPPPPKRAFDASEDTKIKPVDLNTRTDEKDRVEPQDDPDRVRDEEEKAAKETKETEAEEKERDEPKEPGTSPDPEETEFKVVKGTYGDQEIEISSGTTIPTKVAGATQNPTLEDLQKDFSGRVNWDRKYNELNVERQTYVKEKLEFSEERELMEGNVAKLVEETKTKPFAFYDFVANVHKLDPVKLKMEAIRAMVQQVEPISKMSEDERVAYFKSLEVDFKSEATEARERALDNRDQNKALRLEAANLREEYGVSDEDFLDAKKEAAKYIQEGQKLTPKDVIFVQRHLLVAEIINTERKDLAERKESMEILEKVRDYALDHPSWKRQDIVDLLGDGFPKEAADDGNLKRLGRKVKTDTATKPREKSKVKDPVRFEELDW